MEIIKKMNKILVTFKNNRPNYCQSIRNFQFSSKNDFNSNSKLNEKDNISEKEKSKKDPNNDKKELPIHEHSISKNYFTDTFKKITDLEKEKNYEFALSEYKLFLYNFELKFSENQELKKTFFDHKINFIKILLDSMNLKEAEEEILKIIESNEVSGTYLKKIGLLYLRLNKKKIKNFTFTESESVKSNHIKGKSFEVIDFFSVKIDELLKICIEEIKENSFEESKNLEKNGINNNTNIDNIKRLVLEVNLITVYMLILKFLEYSLHHQISSVDYIFNLVENIGKLKFSFSYFNFNFEEAFDVLQNCLEFQLLSVINLLDFTKENVEVFQNLSLCIISIIVLQNKKKFSEKEIQEAEEFHKDNLKGDKAFFMFLDLNNKINYQNNNIEKLKFLKDTNIISLFNTNYIDPLAVLMNFLSEIKINEISTDPETLKEIKNDVVVLNQSYLSICEYSFHYISNNIDNLNPKYHMSYFDFVEKYNFYRRNQIASIEKMNEENGGNLDVNQLLAKLKL